MTAARGRWLDILADAGLPHELLDGKGHPCPRCGGKNRFAAFADVAVRGSVHCRVCFSTTTDPRPGDGLASIRWAMGLDTAAACRWLADWLGIGGRPAGPPMRRAVVRSIRLEPEQDTAPEPMGTLAERCSAAMRPEWMERLSRRLNLPADVLLRLRVGWSAEHRATTWPMVDSAGVVILIRLRCPKTGKKWSVKNGRAGLFVATNLVDAPERLYITEGPTDTAAVLSVGLTAIGRASASGNVAMECRFVRAIAPTECIIIADRDDAGRRGAESLAVPLLTCCRSVRVITPPEPLSDVREWVAGGGTAADIIAAADAAKPRSLRMVSGVSL